MNNLFYFLLFLTFVANVGIAIIAPVMPILIEEYGFSVGHMSTVFLSIIIARFLAQNTCGRLIAKAGTKRILKINFFMFSLIMFYYPFVESKNIFLVLRFLEGWFEGISLVCLNYLAIELSDKKNRGRHMGLFSAMFGLGFILGPAIGSTAHSFYGFKGMFWSASFLGLIGFSGLMVLKNDLLNKEKDEYPDRGILPRIKVEYFKYITLYGPYLLRRILFFSFIIVLPLFLHDIYKISTSRVGLIFTMSGIITTSLMPVAGKVSDKISPHLIVVFNLLMMVITISSFGLISEPILFFLVFALETIAFSFMLPAAMKIFSNTIDQNPEKASILGLYGSLVDIATMLIPYIILPLYYVNDTLPWLFLGTISTIVTIPYLRRLIKNRKSMVLRLQ